MSGSGRQRGEDVSISAVPNVLKDRAKTASKSGAEITFWRGFGSFGGWSVLLLRMPSGACRLECRLRMPSGVVLLRMPSGVVLCEPYPTPRLGIAAPQAVSEISGCGVGVPHPIANPMMSNPRATHLWGRGPAKMEPLLTLQSEGSVRFEQFWDAVFSRT